MEFVLAAIGLGLMFGLSGAGSSIGVVIGGNSMIGALRKRPEIFGTVFVLSALPATIGLYGFVAFILFNSLVSAHMTLFAGAVIFGAGVGMGVVNLFCGIKMGQVCASGISSMGMGHNAFAQTLLSAALPEFYAILGLVCAIMMRGLIPV